jgi:MFS-type transporter involved in bile tolerance (Atg22 family)
VIFLAVGTLAMGAAATPSVFIIGLLIHPPVSEVINRFIGLCITVFGGGYVFSMRSYLTSLVAKDEVAFLYSLIAVFEGVGTLLSTPLLAKTLAKGIQLGGRWIGLPFFVVSILYSLSGLITWRLPVTKLEQ